jgi:ATP:corrinoid adenosyltransferase
LSAAVRVGRRSYGQAAIRPGTRELTDTMAEMTQIKHASNADIPALREIEY